MKFIDASDLHLCIDRPRCRIDVDWIKTQKDMLDEIVSICNSKNIPLFILGDVFDRPKVPSIIECMFLDFCLSINKGVRLIAGNHSLPYHSFANVQNSSFGVIDSLVKSNKLKINYFDDIGKYAHFDETEKGIDSNLIFMHRLVFKSLKSIPSNCTGVTAQQLIDEVTEINPKIQWIFTGDNHKCFHYENNGIHVVNPGCTIRQSVSEISYKPSVFYVDTEKEIVERIFLNDNAEMVDDSYIKNENERDERIGAFIQGIKKSKKVSLSIIENIDKAIEKNKDNLDKYTIKIIRELVEGNGE